MESILLVRLSQLGSNRRVSLFRERKFKTFQFNVEKKTFRASFGKTDRCNGEVFAQEGRFTRGPLLLLHSLDNSCRLKITIRIFILHTMSGISRYHSALLGIIMCLLVEWVVGISKLLMINPIYCEIQPNVNHW